MSTVATALKEATHFIKLDGTSTEETDVEAGAVIACWRHAAETQGALKGIDPGRKQTIVVVVDADAYDTDDESAEQAIESASEYVQDLSGRKPEKPTKVLLVSKDDLPDYEEIADALEEAIQDMANGDAAAAWSTIDDQTMIDLEEQGYDDQCVWIIAYCGDAVAVDGSEIVSPHWYKELDLKKGPVAEHWADATSQNGKYAAVNELEGWLRKEGYERTDRGGAWPGGTEIEIQMDHVIRHVAKELGVPEDLVERVADKNDLQDKNGLHYVSSDDGDIEVWAKKADEQTPNKRKRKR